MFDFSMEKRIFRCLTLALDLTLCCVDAIMCLISHQINGYLDVLLLTSPELVDVLMCVISQWINGCFDVSMSGSKTSKHPLIH